MKVKDLIKELSEFKRDDYEIGFEFLVVDDKDKDKDKVLLRGELKEKRYFYTDPLTGISKKGYLTIQFVVKSRS